MPSSASKLLKATIDAEGGQVTKVHDLAALLNDCLAKHPLWSVMRNDLELLSQYAVLFRYPGHSADKAKALAAVAAMNRCRAEILTFLGTPVIAKPVSKCGKGAA
ncbi:MAG: HEPN domain-containing protein [bacterium]